MQHKKTFFALSLVALLVAVSLTPAVQLDSEAEWANTNVGFTYSTDTLTMEEYQTLMGDPTEDLTHSLILYCMGLNNYDSFEIEVESMENISIDFYATQCTDDYGGSDQMEVFYRFFESVSFDTTFVATVPEKLDGKNVFMKVFDDMDEVAEAIGTKTLSAGDTFEVSATIVADLNAVIRTTFCQNADGLYIMQSSDRNIDRVYNVKANSVDFTHDGESVNFECTTKLCQDFCDITDYMLNSESKIGDELSYITTTRFNYTGNNIDLTVGDDTFYGEIVLGYSVSGPYLMKSIVDENFFRPADRYTTVTGTVERIFPYSTAEDTVEFLKTTGTFSENYEDAKAMILISQITFIDEDTTILKSIYDIMVGVNTLALALAAVIVILVIIIIVMFVKINKMKNC